MAGQQALQKTIESLREQINRAKAQVHLAQSGEKSVKIKQQQVIAAKSELALAEGRLEQARLQLTYTQIKAPARGHITKKNIEAGNQVQAGQPLMALVPLERLWIQANYKETQLTRVKSGQKVSIKVDTFPGKKLQGRVESIMAGTGSAIFNLLRNLGGSFGVAFITTVLSRRTQFHQSHLSEGFSIYDFKLQQAVPILQGRGMEGTTVKQGALEILYGLLQKQAAMLGFDDVFTLLFIFFLCLVPLIWVIRRSATVMIGRAIDIFRITDC